MSWSPRRVLLLVLLCAGLAAPGLLQPADPVAAEALWQWAQTQSEDLTHPAYIDATEAAARLRPWHPGYHDARARIDAVGRARLAGRDDYSVAGQASQEQMRLRSP